MENKNATVHCAFALSFYYLQFRHTFPTPLSWNSKEHKFYPTSNYSVWLIFHLVPFTLMAGSSSLFVLMYSSKFPIALVLFSVVVFNLICMNSSLGFVVYFFYDDIILAYSTMKILLEDIGKLPVSQKLEVELQKLDEKWKFISVFLKMTILSLVPMRWILPPFLVYYNLDPYYGLNLFYHWSSSYTEIAVRFVITLIGFIVGVQIYGLTMTSLFLWLEMQSKYLKLLASLTKSDAFFPWYYKFDIVSKIGKNVTSERIRIYMASMFGVIVVCNVITIRNFGEIPFEVFWFIPTISWFNCLLFYFMVPYLTECMEDTKQMILEKEGIMTSSHRSSVLEIKWGKMKIRSLKPIAMHCGGTFPLKKHTKSEFLLAIVQRTLDGILI